MLWTINYKKAFDSIWHSNVSIITTSLSTVFTCTLVYPFFPRCITWRIILGSASSLLHWFMSVSDKSAALLLIMESLNVTHNIDCLPSWLVRNLFARYLLRFVLFVTLLRNLLMKFGGISEQLSNVIICPVPDPRSSLVRSFKLPSKYRSVMTSHLLNKEDMSMISL